MQTQPYLLHVN